MLAYKKTHNNNNKQTRTDNTMHYKNVLEVETVPEVFEIFCRLLAAVCFLDSAVSLPAGNPCLLVLAIILIHTIQT